MLTNNLYQLIYKSMNEGIYVFDSLGKIIEANPASQSILGYKIDFALGKIGHNLFHVHKKNDETSIEKCRILRAFKNNESFFGEEVFLSSDGKFIDVEVFTTPLEHNGKFSGHLLMFRDITYRKNFENNLKQQVEKEIKKRSESDLFYNHIFETANLGICLTDKTGKFILVNPAYCRIYGYEKEELIGESFTKVVPVEQRVYMQELHDKFIYENIEEIPREWDVIGKGGKAIHIVATAGKMDYLENGPYKITTITDMTKSHEIQILQKKQESMLIEQRILATTDPLTGLYNRLKIDEIFEEYLKKSLVNNFSFSIIIIDIDNFKTVNDTYGHQSGDIILQEFSSLIKLNIRAEDMLGRWGGEEFLIITSIEDINKVESFASKLRKIIENFEFSIVGQKTASFGISTYHKNDDAKSMIKRADDALYLAKKNGRNQVRIENYKKEK